MDTVFSAVVPFYTSSTVSSGSGGGIASLTSTISSQSTRTESLPRRCDTIAIELTLVPVALGNSRKVKNHKLNH